MSDEENRWQNRADDPHIMFCPGCGYDGAFGGLGAEQRTYNVEEHTISELRYRFHCEMCNTEFLTVRKRTEVDDD